MTNVSAIGLQLLMTSALQNEQTTLGTLSEQLASNQKYDNLTQYSPTDALNLLNFQNAVTQKQSYLSSIQTVQARLSTYDTTMTDMENITSQASTLASQNENYNASTVSQIQSQVKNYLLQVSDDLNQQVSGRYVYAGLRYTTQPVTTNGSILSGTPQSIITNGTTLPDYDTQKIANGNSSPVPTSKVTYDANLPSDATVGFSSTPATVQVLDSAGHLHDATYTWTKEATNSWDLNVSIPDASYSATIPMTFNDGTSGPAGSLETISSGTGYMPGTPSSAGDDANVGISVNFGSGAQQMTLDFGTYGGVSGLTQNYDSNNPVSVTGTTFTQDGLAAGQTNNANAYTADTALVDSGLSVTYGVSSDDPSFQRLINGLRYINAAATAGQGGDTATYQADMQQAATMLGTALTGIQTLHTSVADNQNTLTQQTATQNTDITNLQDQLGNIQQVDLTQVGTEINLLQTQLQASYSATASLEQLSLVKYL